jgi:hypothetical protein
MSNLTIPGLPGKSLAITAAAKTSVEVDNSMLDKELLIAVPTEKPYVATLEYKNGANQVKTRLPFTRQGNQLRINIAELLKLVPPEGQGKLLIQNGSAKQVIQIKRNGLVPREFKDLGPLYEQIALDIKQRGSFTITVPVVLWDASFTGAGYTKTGAKRIWADGTKPDANLYWGAGGGIYTMLKYFNWSLVHEEKNEASPLRRALFSQKFAPSSFWQNKGIKSNFTVNLALIAFDHRDIEKGYRYFGDLLTGKKPEPLRLPSGQTIDLAQSRMVGLASHYIPEAKNYLGQHLDSPSPKGTFAASCFGASEFAPLLLRKNLFPVLFSIPTTSAEGYVYLPAIEGLIQGQDLNGILGNVSKNLFKYKGVRAGARQYTNPAGPRFESALSLMNNDWDGDGISNMIDPQPTTVNRFKLDRQNGTLRINTAGNDITIHLRPEEFPLFIKE